MAIAARAQVLDAVTQRVRVNGRNIAVDFYGRLGRPVVLLHGIPGWRGTWRKVASLLVSGHRVIAPDLMGFGESDEPEPADCHAEGQARMVLGLLDTLGVNEAHLVGFDFGGPIAVTVYRLQPARVLSLTLAGTNTFTDTPIPGPLRVAGVPLVGPLVFRCMFGRAGLAAMWRVAVGDRTRFPYREYRSYLRWDAGIRWTRQIFYASMRDLRGLYRDVEDTLRRIRVPATVIWGDRDPFFPLAVGERTARAIPNASFVLLHGCGHFIPEERPEAFASYA
ncbi:MAG: alpha/beta hydrolase [Armatimonadetes bacterium]|nr:alpha/beta hydrolase [Armatimonadota bacterium]